LTYHKAILKDPEFHLLSPEELLPFAKGTRISLGIKLWPELLATAIPQFDLATSSKGIKISALDVALYVSRLRTLD